MRLLLVEDDRHLGKATSEGLRDVYAVDWVLSAEEAEDAILTNHYDLAILDINLPGKSGLDLLSLWRKAKVATPVLFLTARDTVRHRIEGLNTGADDYLVKPFDLDELIARCAALIRRSLGNVQTILDAGDIRYEPASGSVEKGGKAVMLSARERAILDVLMHNRGRPVSKNHIIERIYDWSSEDIESNTIEVHVSALRRKLGKEFIKTMRGVGYMVSA